MQAELDCPTLCLFCLPSSRKSLASRRSYPRDHDLPVVVDALLPLDRIAFGGQFARRLLMHTSLRILSLFSGITRPKIDWHSHMLSGRLESHSALTGSLNVFVVHLSCAGGAGWRSGAVGVYYAQDKVNTPFDSRLLAVPWT